MRDHQRYDGERSTGPASRPQAAGTPGKATLVEAEQERMLDRQLEAHGEGRALDGPIKHELETETGYRLDSVRIHVGGATGALLAAHGRRGAAKGRHILLADGAFAPDSPDGKQLLRHELHHVIQQANGQVPGDLDPHRRAGFEAEADGALAHHGGKELRELSPPDSGPAQFRLDAGGPPPPVHHAAPAHHAAPVFHPVVGDDHWNDARRAAPVHHAPPPVHHVPPPVHHAAPVYHPVVGDDHWNDASRAAHHAPPVHHAAPASHPVVGDDHWNDARRAAHHAPPEHHAAYHPVVGDDHWNDANLRGQHIAAMADRAAARGGGRLPLVGPMFGNLSRAAFVAHLSRHDRADLAAYEHAEHIVHDGVAAVRRQQQAEHAEHHHSSFSLHTLTHAGGAAIHAVVHSPGTIKDAAVGAYHHPLEAGKAVLQALSVDTDDIGEAFSDLRHGRIKHFLTQRLKAMAGQMILHPGLPMPEGFITNAREDRQVFDDVVHGDVKAARHDALKAQAHELVNAISWLPGAKLGKAPKLLEALGKLGKLSRLGKLGKAGKAGEAVVDETVVTEGGRAGGVVTEGAHGAGPHGEARAKSPRGGHHGTDDAHPPEHAHVGKPARDAEHAHGEEPHGERPHGEEPHGERPHGKDPHGGSQAHDEPAPGPETTDAPPPARAHDRGTDRRPSHAPDDPARVPRIREALHKATDFLERLANLPPASKVGQEAYDKADAAVRAAHVPGTRPYSEVNAAAHAAGRAARAEAVTELRDRQGDLVEKLVEIADVAEVGLPTNQATVLPVLIRTGRYVLPFVKNLAWIARRDPRAALRQLFSNLLHG
jgi:uncharacterized protein DUF4157